MKRLRPKKHEFMAFDDVKVALHVIADDLSSDRKEITELKAAAHEQSERLAHLEEQTNELLQSLGVNVASSDKPSAPECRLHLLSHQRSFDQIAAEAHHELNSRGVDESSLRIEDLISAESCRRIELQFDFGFRIECSLDKYDIAFLSLAGLAASLVDFLIVRIPKDLSSLGASGAKGSPLTKWLRSQHIPPDNFLAQHFKTSYDKVNLFPQIPGFSPTSHRLQTLGHDPFIGLVVGVIDIMRGGMSAVTKNGDMIFRSGLGEPIYNPLEAVVWHLMHLLSDIPTSMGLPLPGWSLLQLFQVGSFGERERTVADLSRVMYRGGYDTWHLATMATSVAAGEILLRSYFLLRQHIDSEYAVLTKREASLAGSATMSSHPRFLLMALLTHGIASAANAGKVACYGGNPLAINYAQWLWFTKALHKWMQSKCVNPADFIVRAVKANATILEGWPKIDVDDPSFPQLIMNAEQPI